MRKHGELTDYKGKWVCFLRMSKGLSLGTIAHAKSTGVVPWAASGRRSSSSALAVSSVSGTCHTFFLCFWTLSILRIWTLSESSGLRPFEPLLHCEGSIFLPKFCIMMFGTDKIAHVCDTFHAIEFSFEESKPVDLLGTPCGRVLPFMKKSNKSVRCASEY